MQHRAAVELVPRPSRPWLKFRLSELWFCPSLRCFSIFFTYLSTAQARHRDETRSFLQWFLYLFAWLESCTQLLNRFKKDT
jgi:hypothetical protein